MTSPVQQNPNRHFTNDLTTGGLNYKKGSPEDQVASVDHEKRENQRKIQILMGMVNSSSYFKMRLLSDSEGACDQFPSPKIDMTLPNRTFGPIVVKWRCHLHSFDKIVISKDDKVEGKLTIIQQEIIGYITSLKLSPELALRYRQSLDRSIEALFLESDPNTQRSSSVSSAMSSESEQDVSGISPIQTGSEQDVTANTATSTSSDSDSDWEEIRNAIDEATASRFSPLSKREKAYFDINLVEFQNFLATYNRNFPIKDSDKPYLDNLMNKAIEKCILSGDITPSQEDFYREAIRQSLKPYLNAQR